MGKQTNISGSRFGGEWTKQKLHIINEYLKQYSIVLKNQNVKKIYIDGFAGSGITEVKNKVVDYSDSLIPEMGVSGEAIESLEGSALLSMRYEFDEYFFLEIDDGRIEMLKNNIRKLYPNKVSKVHFIKGDCNTYLLQVISNITKYDRCLMFLDPYALELKWTTLEAISKCGVVDLWYLFPLSLLRLIEKNKRISKSNKHKVTSILGSDDWERSLFVESPQIDLFGEMHYDRIDYDKTLEYVKDRFKTIFPFVSDESKLLQNEDKSAPMFLLCFMMTNTSEKAQALAGRLVKNIIKSTEKIK